MSQIINFHNAIASVKEEFSIDEGKLRNCQVFAKLFLAQGTKYADKQFMRSESKAYIKAELFIVGSKGQLVFDNRMFVNIDPLKSTLMANGQFYYVELIHPTFEEGENVEW